jgi:hypothetical protein
MWIIDDEEGVFVCDAWTKRGALKLHAKHCGDVAILSIEKGKCLALAEITTPEEGTGYVRRGIYAPEKG